MLFRSVTQTNIFLHPIFSCSFFAVVAVAVVVVDVDHRTPLQMSTIENDAKNKHRVGVSMLSFNSFSVLRLEILLKYEIKGSFN